MSHRFRMCMAALMAASAASWVSARDWPQWCGSDAKNMVSLEKGLPDTFVPGDKLPDGTIDLTTSRNVRWGVRLANAVYSTPTIAQGKIFVGGVERGNGIFVCLEAATGKLLW